MIVSRVHKILIPLLAITLLATACGSAQLDESVISTRVALTVQAQTTPETLPTATASVPTMIPSPLTPITTSTVESATPIAGNAPVEFCTASALLVGETIPDGTILQPGTTFTKSWQVQNTGTCTWDSNWQLVFHGGALMDGAPTYSFPQLVQPGDIVDIPILLRAPAEGGQHTGEWVLKSPWGESFGVGQYSVPLSVSIVVGSITPENRRTETVYGVTAVTYEVERSCTAANTFYTITANITSNGPVDVTFTWVQSDGNNKRNNRLSFTEASTKSVQREWSQHRDSSRNQRWVQVIIDSPGYQEFPPVILPDLCE